MLVTVTADLLRQGDVWSTDDLDTFLLMSESVTHLLTEKMEEILKVNLKNENE